MSVVISDVKHAFRGLLRAPRFAIASILTLAIGIGCTTGIFGLVRAIVLDPLSFDPDDRMVRIWPTGNLDISALQLIRSEARGYDVVSGYATMDFVHLGDDAPRRLMGAAVSPGHFTMTGARPAIGRLFQEMDAAESIAPVVVLSHGTWLQLFGGDASILGRTVRIARDAVIERTVIGVMPSGYRDIGYGEADVWIPLPITPSRDPATGDLFVTGQLAQGVSVAQATEELRPLAAAIRALQPGRNSAAAVERAAVTPLRAFFVPETITRTLTFLLMAGGLVFVVACGNVTNLLVVRARQREREMSLRSALGATPKRVFLLAMTETSLIGVLGGALGATAAWLAQGTVVRYLTALRIPRLQDVALTPVDLTFAAGLSLVAVLSIGWFPARRLSRRGTEAALCGGARGGGYGPGFARAGRFLVAVQVALATVVAVAALLMSRSGVAIRNVDPGFDPGSLLAVRLELDMDAESTPESVRRRIDAVRDRVASVPGIRATQLARCAPLTRCTGWTLYWRGDEDTAVVRRDRGFRWFATPGFFESLNIPLLAGRLFDRTPQDNGRRVAVLSRSMAAALWPDELPVGRTIRFSVNGPEVEVIGVVGDVLHNGLDQPAWPTAWVPIEQYSRAAAGYADLVLLAEVVGDLQAQAQAVRQAVWQVEARLPLDEVAPMSLIARGRGGPSDAIRAFLLVFTGLALFLSFAGIYGTASYTIANQRRETAIRVAVGASPGRVITGTVGRGMTPVALGLIGGAVVAPLFSRTIESFLFGVTPGSVTTYAAIAAAVLLVGGVANAIPALAAARVAPSDVLAEGT